MRGKGIQSTRAGAGLENVPFKRRKTLYVLQIGGGGWYRFGGRSALNSLLMASISSGRKEPRSDKTDVGRESETGGERRG